MESVPFFYSSISISISRQLKENTFKLVNSFLTTVLFVRENTQAQLYLIT